MIVSVSAYSIRTVPVCAFAGILVALLGLLLLSGCKEESAPAPVSKPEVLVVDVIQRDVALYQEWVGSTVGMINATIRPKIQGYVLSQKYTDGAEVNIGDLLFEIDPRQFKAQLDVATSQLDMEKAVLEKAAIHVRRFTPLAAKGAVSEQELEDAIQARAAGRAEVAAAQAQVDQARLDLEWTQIRAPIAGIAGIATVQVGDLVNSAVTLTTVSQVDPIKVSFPVSEIDYLKLAPTRQARQADNAGKSSVTLDLVLADGSTYPHEGHVTVTGRAVNESTGTINIQAVFANPNRLLRPGQFARVRGQVDLRKDALVIPQRAVKQTQGMDQVAIVASDGKVRLVDVELGPRIGTNEWIVETGVSVGDKVVVEGLQKVRPGGVVSAKPAPDAGKKVDKPTGVGG